MVKTNKRPEQSPKETTLYVFEHGLIFSEKNCAGTFSGRISEAVLSSDVFSRLIWIGHQSKAKGLGYFGGSGVRKIWSGCHNGKRGWHRVLKGS